MGSLHSESPLSFSFTVRHDGCLTYCEVTLFGQAVTKLKLSNALVVVFGSGNHAQLSVINCGLHGRHDQFGSYQQCSNEQYNQHMERLCIL